MSPASAGPPANDDRRWVRVTNGIVTIVIGLAVFGVGVGYSIGPVQVLGALILVAGAVTFAVGLIGGSGRT
jgi:uncharacterized membrane protein HdeD (DUF308 family)